MDKITPRILSICSGIGALDLGVKLAVPGARTVCYVEREVYSCAVLAARIRDGVDGDARWVGRRRKTYWKEEICAVGNSVVPLAVALAFQVLHRRLNEG